MSNILILGIDGMLGNMLANVFSQKSSGKLFFTSRRDEPINKFLNGEIINFDGGENNFRCGQLNELNNLPDEFWNIIKK